MFLHRHRKMPDLSMPSTISDDVASALVNLGYKEAVVRKALAEVDVAAETSMEDLLKRALKVLMK